MKNHFPFRQQPAKPMIAPNVLKISIELDRVTGKTDVKVNQTISPLDLIFVLNQTMAGTISAMVQQQSLIIDPNAKRNAPPSTATSETPETIDNPNEPQAS